MLDVPVSSGNHRSERAGTALFATSAMYNPNLDVHACTLVVLGACWIYLLAQVNTALSGPVRRFRPIPPAIGEPDLMHARTLIVHGACWMYTR